MQYTNNTEIPLSLAVWLATDDYDHSDNPMEISTTTLLKPIRQIILARQNRELLKVGDISALTASRMGTAIHTSIETSWLKNYQRALLDLGYPQHVVDSIKVNPKKEDLTEDDIAVYMEIRSSKEVDGYIITGKFDFVAEGALEDFKSTGTYTFQKDTNREKYSQQGSIYRWLNPDIIKSDIMVIQYLFTDWSSMQARQNKSYPQSRLVSQHIPLMTHHETNEFVKDIVGKIKRLECAKQEQLPLCTPEELWQETPTFKYYKDKNKTSGRSTKNFDSSADAYQRLSDDGNKGIVIEVPAQVKRCKYCDVVALCDQAKDLVTTGLLKL